MICPCILNKILEALIQDISILCIVTKKEKCNTILHACNIFFLKIYPCTQKLKQCCKRKKIKMYKEWHFFYEWLCSRFNKVCPGIIGLPRKQFDEILARTNSNLAEDTTQQTHSASVKTRSGILRSK